MNDNIRDLDNLDNESVKHVEKIYSTDDIDLTNFYLNLYQQQITCESLQHPLRYKGQRHLSCQLILGGLQKKKKQNQASSLIRDINHELYVVWKERGKRLIQNSMDSG